MDIAIWIMQSPENADAVLRALLRFGETLLNPVPEDLQRDDTIFQIGIAPRRINIIAAASGLHFEEAYSNSMAVEIDGIEVHIPSLADLIRNKRASGRTRDLADAETLEELRAGQPPDPGK
jgi:hypothetical protein